MRHPGTSSLVPFADGLVIVDCNETLEASHTANYPLIKDCSNYSIHLVHTQPNLPGVWIHTISVGHLIIDSSGSKLPHLGPSYTRYHS